MSRRVPKSLTVLIVLCSLLAVPALAQLPEAPSEVAAGELDLRKMTEARAALSQGLVQKEGQLEARGLTVVPDAKALEALANAPQDQGRLQVGVVTQTKTRVDFAEFAQKGLVVGEGFAHAKGAGSFTQDGFFWFSSVKSPGATAVRLHFTDVALPRGAEIYVYNKAGQAFGPYAGQQNFWTHTVFGSEIRVQIQYQGVDSAAALAKVAFTIEEVVHLSERFLLARMSNPEATIGEKAFCSFNASCVQNASCSSIPSAIAATANGIAHLQFTVGSSAFICSGGLLNDTDTSTQIPYLLTANHCFSSSSSASSLEAFFQFTTSCGGSCSLGSGVPSVVGSTLLSTNATSDYTFVRLNSTPPSGSVYLGWSSGAVAFANGTSLYRLSHPKGAPQAYSTHSVSTSKGTCGSWPRGNWIYSADTYGATEGGSSGSPVLNSSGQVVGQLSGACGTNPSNPCASSSNATVDGALAAYFSSVENWLDPPTSGGCHTGSPGGASYCSSSCPCDDGYGDCDSDSECVSGTECVSNVGPSYGWASWVDVCETASDPNSCVGNCGSQAPGGCWCDSSCSFYGDCCSDKVAICG